VKLLALTFNNLHDIGNTLYFEQIAA